MDSKTDFNDDLLDLYTHTGEYLPISQFELELTGYIPKRCECGSAKTYGNDTTWHSDWCPMYVKP